MAAKAPVSDEVWSDNRGDGVNGSGRGSLQMRAGARGPIPSSEAIVRSECRGESVGMRMSLQSSQREEDRCGCWALLLIFGS